MDTFADIAEERRRLADLLSGLTSEQQAAQSLCDEWSVHDVAAHLITPLEVNTPKFFLTMLACRGNFDRAKVRLTRQQARRPMTRDVPEEPLRKSLDFLTRARPRGLVPVGALEALRFQAQDIDWAHGSGPTVSGDAEPLLLAITGRTTALGVLNGDGLPTLHARLSRSTRR